MREREELPRPVHIPQLKEHGDHAVSAGEVVRDLVIEPVKAGFREVYGCLGATEHKTGFSKALDPKVPNHIPF
jgi:hypothetical protein